MNSRNTLELLKDILLGVTTYIKDYHDQLDYSLRLQQASAALDLLVEAVRFFQDEKYKDKKIQKHRIAIGIKETQFGLKIVIDNNKYYIVIKHYENNITNYILKDTDEIKDSGLCKTNAFIELFSILSE